MRPWYRFCRFLCHVFFLGFLRGRVFARENVPVQGGVLLVCNHQSFLDPVLATLGLPRECHYMARDTLFAHAWLRPLIESLNAFPVRRGTADIGAIKETLKRLRGGALVTVFPEATRTADGAVAPMQPGVVLIARKAQVPLVPTLILGAFEVWPRRAPLPRPSPVIVAYGEPITSDQLATLTDQQAIDCLRDRILALMAAYRSHPLVAGALRPLPSMPQVTPDPA